MMCDRCGCQSHQLATRHKRGCFAEAMGGAVAVAEGRVVGGLVCRAVCGAVGRAPAVGGVVPEVQQQ